MTAQTDGRLQFGTTYTPAGFTSPQVSQFDGSAEPVVRELIQNSLDAADVAGRPALVRFILTDIATKELPGWPQYYEAFIAAKKERQKRRTEPSHDERMIIGRIDGLVSRKRIPILICADNGCGLDPLRMISLLTAGNTDKGEGGAGSFGLGHHAAFGASDLRYVLYGSRYNSETSTCTISSGHAILASRTGNQGEQLAPEGYWRRTGYSGSAWTTGDEFPATVPDLLESHLPVDTTGTVVAITGFNDFHRDDDEASVEDQIMQVAVANFSAAVHEERLTVEVIGRNGTSHATNCSTIDTTLDGIKERKRATKAGQITGAQAYAAWQTQKRQSAKLEPLDGAKVVWRSLDAAKGEQTQIHVFRRGMWISSRVERLLKRDFASTWPFDAVVTLSSGRLEELIRASEGPEHRGVDRKRLTNEQKRELKAHLTELADKLRAAVGERNDIEEYIPQSFAILDGHHIRKAEQIRLPRRPPGGGGAKAPVRRGTRRGNVDRQKQRRRGTPRPGTIPSYRHALRYLAEEKLVEILLQYDEETNDQHLMGIRIRHSSGADGTCEQPLPDDYLRLVSVKDIERAIESRDRTDEGAELVLPAVGGERKLRVKLADGQPSNSDVDPHLLSIDIVKRAQMSP